MAGPESTQQIRFCTAADGVRIAYAESGKGMPLVRVGGWLTHIEYCWQSPVWQHWMEELSSSFRLFRYDARGCGLSDRDVTDLSFEAWLRDLGTVVDAAGLDRFPLMGTSQGASVAIAYAARNPGRVSHLILTNGYARGWRRRNPTPEQARLGETMVTLAELGWGKDNPSFRQFFTSQFIPDGNSEQHQWFNELERRSTSPETAAAFLRVIAEIDVAEEARHVACPTLVLHCDRDARVPFEEGRVIASLIPGARFVAIESRNHILLAEEPGWRTWLSEVRNFLGSGGDPARAFPLLSRREAEVVELIAQGLDNAQIGARLELSEKTVRNNISQIFDRLGVENRSQAIVRARDAGFGRTRP